MVRITDPNHIIEIEIHHYPEIKGDAYYAWIKGEDYRGIAVQGKTIGDCISELGISLQAVEQYRLNTKKENEKTNNPSSTP